MDTKYVLPVAEYENEVVDEVNFLKTLDELHGKFDAQTWVQALLDKRRLDNHNKVHMDGRTYEVTGQQLKQVHRFFFRFDQNLNRLYGYDLIEIPEAEYIQKFFPDGHRIVPVGTN